jgi:group I intron endonuclease
MSYGHIYKITNLINNKCYYGQTRQPPNRRWSQHKQNAKKGGKMVLYAAMRKHGIENFTFEILQFCNSKSELAYYEAKQQFDREVLLKEDYYNGIINLRIGRLKNIKKS